MPKKKEDSTMIECPEGASAIVFFGDGGMEVAMPVMPDDTSVEIDSPCGRMGLTIALFQPENEGVRNHLWEQMQTTVRNASNQKH